MHRSKNQFHHGFENEAEQSKGQKQTWSNVCAHVSLFPYLNTPITTVSSMC